MAKRIKPDKNSLTFYNCSTCGEALRLGEAAMGTDCTKCLLKKAGKWVEPMKVEEKSFEMKRFTYERENELFIVIVYADEMFNPTYVIQDSTNVVLYTTEYEKSPEGISLYNMMVSEGLIFERDNKPRWS